MMARGICDLKPTKRMIDSNRSCAVAVAKARKRLKNLIYKRVGYYK
jgi:hypothetical protein